MTHYTTHQQIQSTTIRRQRVVNNKYIGSYVDRYNQIKTTVRNEKQWQKRSKQTMEATKSEIWQLVVSTITFSVSLLHSPIRSNKHNTQQTRARKKVKSSWRQYTPELVSCLRVHMYTRRQVAAEKGVVEAIPALAIVVSFAYLLPTNLA